MRKLILGLTTVACVSLFASQMPASYGKCVGCHGADGSKVALGKSEIIKNMTKEDIVKALKGYKDGTYGKGMKNIMIGQVGSLGDKDIQDIANYIGK
jgi:cytochrome c553